MTRKTMGSALMFATILTTSAWAEEPGRDAALPHTVTVDATIGLGDVDLGTPAGVAEAERRATRIAREMCRPVAVPGPGPGRVDGRCYRQAMADARRQLDRAIAARRGEANVQTALVDPRPGTSND